MRFQQVTQASKPVKIDLKDKKILWELAQNSRAAYTEIAKKVGLSNDSVKYRINQLTKKGVIQGYRTLVDVGKFGYNGYHIFLQLSKPTKEIESELIRKFCSYPFVRAVLKFSGKFDFEIATAAKTISEFDDILGMIINDCGQYLQDYEILIIRKPYVANTFPRSFLKETVQKIPSEARLKVDGKDLLILKVIGDDATVPLYRIADKARLSVDAVNYRLKKMQKSGVVLRFLPVINYASIGYNVYAVLLRLQNMTQKRETNFKSFLQDDPHMLWCVKTIGRFNAILYICTSNVEDLHSALIKLRNTFSENIKSYETLLAYEEYKYTYMLDSLEI